MNEPQQPTGGPGDQPAALLFPLLPLDPPRVGGYWLDARLTASPSGVAWAAHADDGTALELVVRGRALPARVVPLPFAPHRYAR